MAGVGTVCAPGRRGNRLSSRRPHKRCLSNDTVDRGDPAWAGVSRAKHVVTGAIRRSHHRCGMWLSGLARWTRSGIDARRCPRSYRWRCRLAPASRVNRFTKLMRIAGQHCSGFAAHRRLGQCSKWTFSIGSGLLVYFCGPPQLPARDRNGLPRLEPPLPDDRLQLSHFQDGQGPRPERRGHGRAKAPIPGHDGLRRLVS